MHSQLYHINARFLYHTTTLCVYHMVRHLVNSVPSSHISIQIKHWLGIYLCICFNLSQDTLLRSQLAVWQRINPASPLYQTTSSHSPGGSFHFHEVSGAE